MICVIVVVGAPNVVFCCGYGGVPNVVFCCGCGEPMLCFIVDMGESIPGPVFLLVEEIRTRS